MNLRLTAVTALVLTYANDPWTSVMVTDAAGDSVTFAVPGKKLQVPASGHTKDYFTIDDFHSDLGTNTLITDAIVNSVAIDVQPGAHAHITTAFLGLNAVAGAAQYFVAPTDAPTGALLAGPEGKLRYDTADSAVVTGVQFTIDAAGEVKAVVGANVSPDAFRNGVKVSGSLTSLFDGGAILTNFDDEAEAPLFVYLFADSTAGSEFMIFKLPNAKINSADKAQDGPAVSLSGNFSAGKLVDGSTVKEQTTIVIMDSSVA